MITRFLKIWFGIVIIVLLILGASQDLYAQKGWPKGVTIAGSNLGSAHYIYAGAWSKILADKLKIQVTVEVTQGPVINVQLVDSKQTDFGPVTMAIASEGYTGTGWAQGKKYPSIRNLLPMNLSYMHWWVLAKFPINSIHDMNGYDIALSGAGSSPDVFGRRLFEFFNIKPKRIISGGFGDSNNLMRDGLLAASAAFGGIPHPSAVEIATTHDMKIVGVSKSDAEKFIAKNPGISIDTIPAGTYKGQDKPVDTITLWTSMICHKDLAEDFVYAILKETFQNRDALIAAFKAAKDTTTENIRFMLRDLPLHAGAVKYYKEKGISIPDIALPPEYKK